MIPNNVIVFKQSNNDFVNKKTNVLYKGPYYEYNNKTYAGSAFDANAPELVKIGSDEYNSLLNNSSTATYSNVTGVTSNQLKDPVVNKVISTTIPHNIVPPVTYFFCAKKNETPRRPVQTDEKTYIKLSSDPLYITTFVGTYKGKTQTILEADQQLPGVGVLVSRQMQEGNNTTPISSTPVRTLANQPSTRKTTKIDGKVGEITSKFIFPGSFLLDLNTGNIDNLGLQNNPSLVKFLKENKLTISSMYTWNDFVTWMDSKGYRANPEMNFAEFRIKVLNEYKKIKSNFFIDPANAYEDGIIEEVKDVQRMLQIYRLYLIKKASTQKYADANKRFPIPGQAEFNLVIYDPNDIDPATGKGRERILNILSPTSPDRKYLQYFMEFAIADPETDISSLDASAK